jgi:hypothetical protein
MSSQEVFRVSPIRFDAPPARVEKRAGWQVVLAYEGEEDGERGGAGEKGKGPWLADLSHRSKWDLQNGSLDSLKPFEKDIPQVPGQCALAEGWLVNRMNRTQAALWDLAAQNPWTPIPTFATETTDGLCLLAFMGQSVFSLMEKLTPLDLAAPHQAAPYLVQGPVLHIPCQVVVLDKGPSPVILMAFSRGYGQTMTHAILETGKSLGLRPCGEHRFSERIKQF